MANWQSMRWLEKESDAETLKNSILPTGTALMLDQHNQVTVMFESAWSMRYFQNQFPQVGLLAVRSNQTAGAPAA